MRRAFSGVLECDRLPFPLPRRRREGGDAMSMSRERLGDPPLRERLGDPPLSERRGEPPLSERLGNASPL